MAASQSATAAGVMAVFQLSDEQAKSIREEFFQLRAGGQDAAAQAWLVWAQIYIHELSNPGPPIESLKKIAPLILWLIEYVGGTPEKIQGILRDSLLQILFKTKLENRDLSVSDGHHAILIVRQSLTEPDA